MKSLLSILFSSSGPKSYVHFITNRCNARCDFCFIDFGNQDSQKPAFEASLEDIKRATQKLPNSIVNVNLTGGEPFLIKNIKELADHYLSRPKVGSLYITTNGHYVDRISSFTQELVKTAMKGKRVYISISVDGRAEVHDATRKVDGLFERALESYRQIKEYGNSIVIPHLSITVSRSNYETCVEFYEWLVEKGYENIGITLERAQGVHDVDKETSSRVLESYTLLAQKIAARELHLAKEKSFFTFCLAVKNKIMHELVIKSAQGQGDQTPCSAGKDFFVVDANLNVKNCEPQGHLLGNLKSESLQEILSKRENKDYYRKNNIENCCDCSYECAKTVNIMTSKRYLFKALVFAIKAKLGPSSEQNQK